MSNLIKSSFRNRNDRYKLIGHSLDLKKENRIQIQKGKTKRTEVLKSLLFSDNKLSHQLHKKMLDCKKFNVEKVKKDYKKYLKKYGSSYKSDFDRPKYIGQYISSKNVCQSLWCPNCRKFLVEYYKKKVTIRLTQRLLGKRYYNYITLRGGLSDSVFVPKEYHNNDFNHISGVLGLTNVDENEVLDLIKNDTNKWRRIRYRVEKLIPPMFCPFIETVYELELVNWEFLRSSNEVDFKSKQIKQLIEHQRIRGNLFLFVHFHSITNLTKEQINLVFEKEYFVGNKPLIKTNKENGLYVQKFHTTQTLEKNIEKLTSYPFKDPIRFKHSFRGSDYLNGEYFEYDELSKLMMVYQNIQKRNWRGLFRTVEHSLSMEMLKYRMLFPPHHNLWKDIWTLYNDKDTQYDFQSLFPKGITNTNSLTMMGSVWVIDKWNNVYTEGWNPNLFFPNKKVKIEFIREGRKVLRREYFFHPKYEWLEIYKNVYESLGVEKKSRMVPLEGYYYTDLYGEMKKGKLFIESLYTYKDLNGNIRRGNNYSELNQKDLLHRGGIKWDLSKFPKNIQFDMFDPLLQQRLNVLKRLDEVDKTKYLKFLFHRSDVKLNNFWSSRYEVQNKDILKKLNLPIESVRGLWIDRLMYDKELPFHLLLKHHSKKRYYPYYVNPKKSHKTK